MSLFFLNMLSILDYKINSLRYKASEVGPNFLDTLYKPYNFDQQDKKMEE